MNRIAHLPLPTEWTDAKSKKSNIHGWCYASTPSFGDGLSKSDYLDSLVQVIDGRLAGQVTRREFDAWVSRTLRVESQLNTLRQLIQGRGVEKARGICGGSARIVRTRIPVWTLESYRRLGSTDAEILAAFPSLNAQDLVNAWIYVAANPHEIENDIQSNEAD